MCKASVSNVRKKICILLFAALISCKADFGGSDSKSIDNFARGNKALTANVCHGANGEFSAEPLLQLDPAVLDDQELTDLVVDATAAALTSIPESVRILFFGHAGIIRVSSRIEQVCKEKLKSELDLVYASEGNKIEACWDIEKDGSFRLYLDASAASVQHHLVRMFARIVSEVITQLPRHFPTEVKEQLKESISAIARFSKSTESLRDIFLAEARANPSRLDLSRYRSFLETDLGIETFKHYVFAESFDSYYCSPATRLAFKDTAPRTYAAFLELNKKYFVKDSDFVKQASAAFNHSQSPYADSAALLYGPMDYLFAPSNTGSNRSYYSPGTPGYQQHVRHEQRTPGQVAQGIQNQNRAIGPAMQNIQGAGNNPLVRGTAAVVNRAAGGVPATLVRTLDTANSGAGQRNAAMTGMIRGDVSSQNIYDYQQGTMMILSVAGQGAAAAAGQAYMTVMPNSNLARGVSIAADPIGSAQGAVMNSITPAPIKAAKNAAGYIGPVIDATFSGPNGIQEYFVP